MSLRHELISSILADRSAILRSNNAELTLITLGGEDLVIIDDGADLRERLARLAKQPAQGAQMFVVIGAGDDRRKDIKSAAPTFQLVRMGFYRMDPSGELVLVTGSRSRALPFAVSRMKEIRPFTDEELAARLEEGKHQAQAVARFGSALGGRMPWVTTSIAVVCVALFAAGQYWSDGSYGSILGRMGADNGNLVKQGEIWRLLASAFLHANAMHLVFNMLALFSFGAVLERLLGARRYLVLYGLCALGGSLVSSLVHPDTNSVGASGAIWGLMTAGVGLALQPRGLLPPLVLARAKRTAFAPLVVNALYSFQPGIDALAHFGGGAVGFLLWMSGAITAGVKPMWTASLPDAPTERREPPVLTAAAGFLAVALVGSVVAALATGKPWEFSQPLAFQRVAVPDTGVSVEMPSPVAEKLKHDHDEGTDVLTYGGPPASPIMVQILYAHGSTEAEPLDQLEREIQQAKFDPFTAQGTPRVVEIAGWKYVEARYTHTNGGQLRMWATSVPGWAVMVRVFYPPSLPKAYRDIDERIKQSLRVAAATSPPAAPR